MMSRFVRAATGMLCMLLLAGCPSIESLVKDTREKISEEKTWFVNFWDAVNNTDNSRVHVFNMVVWAKSLSELNSIIKDIAGALQDAPEKREDAEIDGELALLKVDLDDIFARTVEVDILVPEWDIDRAYDAAKDITRSLYELRQNYQVLYDETPADLHVELRTQVDERLYDTYNACLSVMWREVASNYYKDYCMRAAQRLCTHQMDLTCLENMIRIVKLQTYPRELCAETWPDWDYHGSEPHYRYDIRESRWLSDIPNCHSTTPVNK